MYTQQPLGNFFEKVSTTERHQLPPVSVDFGHLSQTVFKDNIPNLPNMDEHQIAILVKNNTDEIVNDILSGDIPYIGIFSNMNFINGFIRAMSSIPVSYQIRLACNKITYDYFTSENAVPEIKQRYLGLSKIVNRTEINKLIAIGLDDNSASNIVLCRYSSMNEITNVKRLNFTMYYKDPNVFTEQMIVWIYEKLFDRVVPLFNGIMFETYAPKQEEEYGDNFMEIYGAVGLAILDILNNMPSDKIKSVLMAYMDEYSFRGKPPVRFTLRSLSADYSHIVRVVEQMNEAGHNIP